MFVIMSSEAQLIPICVSSTVTIKPNGHPGLNNEEFYY